MLTILLPAKHAGSDKATMQDDLFDNGFDVLRVARRLRVISLAFRVDRVTNRTVLRLDNNRYASISLDVNQVEVFFRGIPFYLRIVSTEKNPEASLI